MSLPLGPAEIPSADDHGSHTLLLLTWQGNAPYLLVILSGPVRAHRHTVTIKRSKRRQAKNLPPKPVPDNKPWLSQSAFDKHWNSIRRQGPADVSGA